MKGFIISVLALLITLPVFAGDNDIEMGEDYYIKIIIDNLEHGMDQAKEEMQTYFNDLSSQLGFGMSYHNSSPAQNLKFGILPTVEVGLDLAILDIDNVDDVWGYVMPNEDIPSIFAIPRLHINMSLPFDFELSFAGAFVPTTNIYLVGGALKWSIIGTHDSFFNLAISGNFSKLIGIEEVSMFTYGANASASLDFMVLVPYLGAGVVRIHSSAEVPNVSEELLQQVDDNPDLTQDQKDMIKSEFNENEPFVELEDYKEMKPNFFFGTRFDLWLLTFNAEVAFSYDFKRSEYINTVYSLRANMSF